MKADRRRIKSDQNQLRPDWQSRWKGLLDLSTLERQTAQALLIQQRPS
jgi:hypothetical protein